MPQCTTAMHSTADSMHLPPTGRYRIAPDMPTRHAAGVEFMVGSDRQLVTTYN